MPRKSSKRRRGKRRNPGDRATISGQVKEETILDQVRGGFNILHEGRIEDCIEKVGCIQEVDVDFRQYFLVEADAKLEEDCTEEEDDLKLEEDCTEEEDDLKLGQSWIEKEDPCCYDGRSDLVTGEVGRRSPGESIEAAAGDGENLYSGKEHPDDALSLIPEDRSAAGDGKNSYSGKEHPEDALSLIPEDRSGVDELADDGWFDIYHEDPWGAFGTCITDYSKQENQSPIFCNFDNIGNDSIPSSHEEAGAGEGIEVHNEDDYDFDLENDIVDKEEASKYMNQITLDRSPANFWIGRSLGEYYVPEPDKLDKINRSLAFYRIKAYELSKGNNIDDEKLKREYPPDTLKEMQYYVKYEEDLEWNFHLEYCNLAGLDDYQRLVPKPQQPSEYNSWCDYRQIFSDYASDKEFVEYYKEIVKKIMWLKDYVHMPSQSCKWRKLHDKAYIQAMKIATGYPRIFPFLVRTGFQDFVWSLRTHYEMRGILQSVYFEIWKRLAKQKKSFRDAMKEVHDENMFPLYSDRLHRELKIGQETDDSLQLQFNTYMAGIHETDLDDEVQKKIKKAIENSIPKTEGYEQYAELKIAIAERIGLVPQC